MIRKLGVGLVVVAALLAPAGGIKAGGTTFIVTKTADTADGVCDADCSLREAIVAANAGAGVDEIQLAAGEYGLTLGHLEVTDSLDLMGSGASNTVIDAGGQGAVIFVVGYYPEVSISGVTIQNGADGAVYNNASLMISDSVIRDSHTGPGVAAGGGILNQHNLTLNRTTLTGNSASEGAALAIDSDGTTLITNSTISGNVGGAIHANGPLTVLSSTIANNSGWAFSAEVSDRPLVFNTIFAGDACGIQPLGDHNLDTDGTCGLAGPGDLPDVDPLLGPLQDNGGPTPTHALLPGNPAIDSGALDKCFVADQRGFERTGLSCDLGAYEFEGGNPTGNMRESSAELDDVVVTGGTVFDVTKTADTADGACDADCSLREAIIAANGLSGADSVTVPAGIYALTIPGGSKMDPATGDMNITDDLTLVGAGAKSTGIDGSLLDSIFDITGAGIEVRLSGVSMRNAQGGYGAVFNDDALLILDESTIENSSGTLSVGGGAITNDGVLVLSRSAIHGNSGTSGALALYPGSVSLIVNSTVSGSTGQLGGVGVGAAVMLINSTIAHNEGTGIFDLYLAQPVLMNTIIANNADGDCAVLLTTGTHNLDSDGTCGLTGEGDLSGAQALLGPLADNGGTTPTHALLPGGCPPPPGDACVAPSAAIEAGGNQYCLAIDQRGAPRPIEQDCDMGAYEYGDNDADTVLDASDNCPTVANPAGQTADADGDLAGDACDAPGSGNVDCSGPVSSVTSVDALKVLRHSAGLSVTQSEPCLNIGLPRGLAPPDNRLMGDVNCQGVVNSVDALLILRANAGLGVALPVGCPEVKPPT